jgi:hypothetical protein
MYKYHGMDLVYFTPIFALAQEAITLDSYGKLDVGKLNMTCKNPQLSGKKHNFSYKCLFLQIYEQRQYKTKGEKINKLYIYI